MDLIEFDQCGRSGRTYRGTFWNYRGIIYEGVPYILKFRSKEAFGESIRLPVSEYVGDRVYEMLGIPAQESVLGTWHGRLAAACKDFCWTPEEYLEEIDFWRLRRTWLISPKDFPEEFRHPKDMHLEGILRILYEYPRMASHPEMKKRFWDTFIIDALLGNYERCMASWGLLLSKDNEEKPAPVFGNGTCLNAWMDDDDMRYDLQDPERFREFAWPTCGYLDAKDDRIAPFQYLKETDNKDCIQEAKRLIPMIAEKQEDILGLLRVVPRMKDVRRAFNEKAIAMRIEEWMLPLLEQWN